MCEHHCHIEKGWKGWLEVPAPHLSPCTGAWIEISHTITEDLARIPAFPQPRIRRIRSLPEAVANLTELCMVAHHGTHVDAPIHYISDGPSMDEVPLERLYGQGVVWHIDRGPNGVIRPEDFEAARPRLKAGDIVILDTGSARHVNTDSYWEHPSVSGEAAAWLVRQGAKILAIDAPTPDLSPKNRSANYQFPAHHTLLSHGVLIAEHMTNLEPLAGRRVEAMFMALNLKGSDGGPARVVARPID
jgi:arylformamidase